MSTFPLYDPGSPNVTQPTSGMAVVVAGGAGVVGGPYSLNELNYLQITINK